MSERTTTVARSVAEVNKHLVFNAVRRLGTAAIDDVVRATQRSQPTVTKWLHALERDGWLQRPGVGASTGGRPPALFRFAADAAHFLGVAVEIPDARLALIDARGAELATRRFRIDAADGPEALLDVVRRQVDAFVAEALPAHAALVGAGVAPSGFLDRERGVWLATPRVPGWTDLPVQRLLARHVGAPVTLHHHVDALALRETSLDPGMAHGAFLYVDVGYGLGVRLVRGGHHVQGSFGNAGLIGHTTVVPEGRRCLCGNRGCLEEYVSGRAVLRFAQGEDAPRRPGHGARAPANGEAEDVHLVAERWLRAAVTQRASAAARAQAEELFRYLALGIANAINVFDVPRVRLGGFVQAAGAAWCRALEAAVRARLQPILARHTEIRFAATSRARAAAHGAALFALREHLPFADPLVVAEASSGEGVSAAG